MCKRQTLAPTRSTEINPMVAIACEPIPLSGILFEIGMRSEKMLFNEWIQWGRTPWHFVWNILINFRQTRINISPVDIKYGIDCNDRFISLWQKQLFFVLLAIAFFHGVEIANTTRLNIWYAIDSLAESLYFLAEHSEIITNENSFWNINEGMRGRTNETTNEWKNEQKILIRNVFGKWHDTIENGIVLIFDGHKDKTTFASWEKK